MSSAHNARLHDSVLNGSHCLGTHLSFTVYYPPTLKMLLSFLVSQRLSICTLVIIILSHCHCQDRQNLKRELLIYFKYIHMCVFV